jgi:glutamate dehydrogenase/leucine dehydrogenase
MTEAYGLWHPQEGVVNGLYQPKESDKIHKIGQLRFGVSKIVEDVRYTPNPMRKYTVADLITGYGVYEAIRHFYDLWNGDLPGKRAIIQGWGNVASSAAYYLAQSGVKIVGIIDRHAGLIDENGFSFDEIRQLYTLKKGNSLSASKLTPFNEINEKIWDLGAEIFVPAAASRLVTQDQLDRMSKRGLEVISCGANVPFADKEIFFGPIAEDADAKVAVIPDFIANCGMARVFAYLMGDNPDLSDESIFQDTGKVIFNALREVQSRCPEAKGLTREAYSIALQQLV